MVYEVKSEKVEEITLESLKGKVMKKVDSLLDLPRISPSDLKIVSEIVKDLDVKAEDKLMSFYDTMLKGISDTNRKLEERDIFSPLPNEVVKKPVKEK